MMTQCMEFNLVSDTDGLLDLQPTAPREFSDLLVADSKVNYAEGNYGRLMFQEIETGPFSIHYNIYHIQTRFLLHFKRDAPLLSIHIALKNDMHYHLSNIGDVHLKEGQFNIAYLSGVEGTAHFEQAGEYRVFKVYFPVDILEQYVTTFPYLSEFLQHVTGPDTAFLLKEHGWISSKISYIINELLECTYEEPVRRLYYDNLIKELFLLLLLQKQRNGNDYTTYMQNLYEARSIIQKNISQHFTIGEVAQQVGLNEAKLKSGFKQVFGTGIFQFMLQVKMYKAWVMVLETDKPVKEIASETGYTSKQNFLTAFKKHFNATPGSLRKR